MGQPLTMRLCDKIHRLPDELVCIIAAYAASPQPPALMVDVRDYCLGAQTLYDAYAIEVGDGPTTAATMMALDIFVFAARVMVVDEGYSHNIYEILMRDPRRRTRDEAYAHMAAVYRVRDACSAFSLFWGLMTPSERAAFVTYAVSALSARAVLRATQNGL